MRIWTDDEFVEVDPDDVGELESAMMFKAEHIKAKADPDLFSAVAFMLEKLWNTATKRVEVVRCRECKHWHEREGWCDEHSNFIDGEGAFCHPWESTEWKMFEPDDFCSYGERKEGAD